MIKKRSETYKLIKDNIGKLALIHELTQYSPSRLVNYFLKYAKEGVEFVEPVFTTEADCKNNPLADKSAYKYFKRHLNEYLKRSQGLESISIMKEIVERDYLSADFLGTSYDDFYNIYRQKEKWIKYFARKAFISEHPITPDMTPTEVAIRNQKLGKISVACFVGDIINYDYFYNCPYFMVADLKRALGALDIFIVRLLTDTTLDQQFKKLNTPPTDDD